MNKKYFKHRHKIICEEKNLKSIYRTYAIISIDCQPTILLVGWICQSFKQFSAAFPFSCSEFKIPSKRSTCCLFQFSSEDSDVLICRVIWAASLLPWRVGIVGGNCQFVMPLLASLSSSVTDVIQNCHYRITNQHIMAVNPPTHPPPSSWTSPLLWQRQKMTELMLNSPPYCNL